MVPSPPIGSKLDGNQPLTLRNEKAKQGAGEAFTNEGAGGENYNTISYLAVSPHEKDVVYTGSDCGLVYVRVAPIGENITPPGVPESLVSSIEVSPLTRARPMAITRHVQRYGQHGLQDHRLRQNLDKAWRWHRPGRFHQSDQGRHKKVKGLFYAGAERGFMFLSMEEIPGTGCNSICPLSPLPTWPYTKK